MRAQNSSAHWTINAWFIPVDILMMGCSIYVVILAAIFSLIVIRDKNCRTVSMLLVLNSFLAEFLFGSIMFSMALFTLSNDLSRRFEADSLCVFRGYLSYALSAARSYSYLLQSMYRYTTVVHPTRLVVRSIRFQLTLIALAWFISVIHPFPFLFTEQIHYNPANQVCHMPLHNYLYIFYTCFLAYLNPIMLIVVIYVKLVRYSKEMSHVVTSANQFLRAQREVKMVRRIVMLVLVLITLGLPYTIFFVLNFFTTPDLSFPYFFFICRCLISMCDARIHRSFSICRCLISMCDARTWPIHRSCQSFFQQKNRDVL